MDKPEEHERSASASPRAVDLRAKLRSQEDEIDAQMELWATVFTRAHQVQSLDCAYSASFEHSLG